ncbi:S8 family peptidase [Halorussus salilacus]|uniref:S8 family peptidase n=1 Tax=Halorussus salilacus TaxID=2953750 RepID=UPI00209D9F02|nr:S8 family peptidase [Halorussus salilacus]USZ67915.1 S8 family peptidase [Halorussus salilacus]
MLQTTGGSLLALGAGGVASAAPDDTVEINVGFKSERGRKAALDAADETVREFAFDAMTVRVPKRAVETLDSNPNVRYVEANGRMRALSWGRTRIGADEANASGYAGEGADVAVIDTGIDADNPCLPNVGNGKAFVECFGTDCENPWDDDNGHGTNVAGVIGASQSCDCTTGVAPDATLHGVKVLDDAGSGSYADIAAGIEYVGEQGWDVGNISLGGSSGSSAVEDACQYAADRGVLLVGAAGGSGPCGDGCVNYPAAYPSVVAVSATDENDALASFSSTGPEIELAAPGVNIPTTDSGGGCTTLSGTSFAAAHVSGVAALLAGEGYSAADARTRMRDTAEDIGLPSDEQGYGLVDAAAAVGL